MPKLNIIRIFDIFFTSILLLIGCVPLLLLIIVKLIVDGRPLFYNSNRIGKDRKSFVVYKFRTMINDREKINQYLESIDSFGFEKIPSDAPIYTKIGRFFEKYQIVEVLQLFNVLEGNMSMIGYRPLPLIRFSQLEIELGKEKLMERHSVLPGITGLSQIVGKSNLTNSERVEIEVYYNKFSKSSLKFKVLRYNILILLETLFQIVLRKDFLLIFRKDKVLDNIFIDDKKNVNQVIKAFFNNELQYKSANK